MDTLFDTAPDFDQPIDVLQHCHGRIRRQTATLRKLLEHLPNGGLTKEAQQAATAVLRYFDKAVANHHADEEQDLLPMLHAAAVDDDAVALQTTATEIVREHQQMEVLWKMLAVQLRAIAAGTAADLSIENVRQFTDLYDAHMEKEETTIVPMARRLLNAKQLTQLGNAMRTRRGITP